jgi:hypothetical protein
MDGAPDEYAMMEPRKSDHQPLPADMLWPILWPLTFGCCRDRGGMAEVTVDGLIAGLRELAPNVVACVMDDQGIPHEIAWIGYRPDLNMVAIASGCVVGCK